VQKENIPGVDEPVVNNPGSSKKVKHKKIIIPMLIYASLMFGLGFAMAPLYELFCEVTGIKDTTARKAIVEYTIDRSRTIRVEFDATINQELEFEFRPMTKFVEINPGELKVVDFYVKNNTGRDVVAQAIPSVTPVLATTHLNKIDCFCFDQQKLKAGEEKIMPLRFVLGTDLPEDISTVTLSYTFMDTNRDKVQKNLNDAEKELKELI
jgi:cytochrome c oxidase assembly protein subunit 11